MFAVAKPVADSPYALYGEELVSQGYSAIPCRPESKRPGSFSGGNWWGRADWQQFCNRAPTEYELRSWTRWPDAGICVALGNGVVAVDVDTDDDELRSALASVLPLSFVQKRGDKGFTAFYRGSAEIKSAAYNINGQRVLDLLAHGKQTVIPPTIHPDTGRPYVWLTAETLLNTPPEALPELPDDVAEQIAAALTPHGYAPQHTAAPTGDGYGNSIWRDLNDRALANLEAWVPHLDLPKLKRTSRGYVAVPFWRPSNRGRPLHDRNPNLKITTQGIRDFHDGDRGYTPIDVVMRALGCSLDFADGWLRQRIGYEEPALLGLEPWFPKAPADPAPDNDNDDEEQETAALPEIHAAEAEFRSEVSLSDLTQPGGFVEELIDWIVSSAEHPSRELALSAVLPFVGALIGRRYSGYRDARTNLYCIALAPSGHGKDHARQQIKRLIASAGLHATSGPARLMSASALRAALKEKPSMNCMIDEIAGPLREMMDSRSGSHQQMLKADLLEMFSSASTYFDGAAYAQVPATRIESPNLCVYGTSTADDFWSSLSSLNARDGFLARLLLFDITGAKPPLVDPVADVKDVPVAIREGARALAMAGRGGSLDTPPLDKGDRAREAIGVPLSDEAEKVRKEFKASIDAKILKADSGDGPILNRAVEHAVKLALIVAVATDSRRPEITGDQMLWATQLSWLSTCALLRESRFRIADGLREASVLKVLRLVRDAGAAGITLGKLIDRTRGLDKRMRMEILEDLLEAQRIRTEKQAAGRKGGKPTARFWPIGIS